MLEVMSVIINVALHNVQHLHLLQLQILVRLRSMPVR